MRMALFLLLMAVGVPLWGDGVGSRAEYVGGTSAVFKARTSGKILTADPDRLEFTTAKFPPVSVPYDSVNLIEYGQKVSRRYAMAVVISPLLLLSKKKKHYLTIGYQDESGEQQALVFEVDKNAIRSLLVALEARTGLKVQYQDDEARKAGKG